MNAKVLDINVKRAKNVRIELPFGNVYEIGYLCITLPPNFKRVTAILLHECSNIKQIQQYGK